MSAVFELRQYTLKPGQRDVLIELFEREFVESQEAVGMEVIGTFYDADDADRFVWLRRFENMEKRAEALAAFYGGPVWQAHREAANATMIDSNDVLLLRPAWPGSGFGALGSRAPVGATASPAGVITAAICHVDTARNERFVAALRNATAAEQMLAMLETEPARNNFPRLPIREGENVVVRFALSPDLEQARAGAPPPDLHGAFAKPVQWLTLLPTPRSRLHG